MLDAESGTGAFYIAVASYHHASEDDRKKHIAELKGLADREFDLAVEARFFCVQWAIDEKDFEFAHSACPKYL